MFSLFCVFFLWLALIGSLQLTLSSFFCQQTPPLSLGCFLDSPWPFNLLNVKTIIVLLTYFILLFDDFGLIGVVVVLDVKFLLKILCIRKVGIDDLKLINIDAFLQVFFFDFRVLFPHDVHIILIILLQEDAGGWLPGMLLIAHPAQQDLLDPINNLVPKKVFDLISLLVFHIFQLKHSVQYFTSQVQQNVYLHLAQKQHKKKTKQQMYEMISCVISKGDYEVQCLTKILMTHDHQQLVCDNSFQVISIFILHTIISNFSLINLFFLALNYYQI